MNRGERENASRVGGDNELAQAVSLSLEVVMYSMKLCFFSYTLSSIHFLNLIIRQQK
jgi:hypothetical protein